MIVRLIRACVLLFLGAAPCLAAPMNSPNLTIAGVSIPPSARTDLRVPVAASATDPATEIPVTVFRGARPGPTLLAVAGVHGYEFASILAVEQLADRFDPAHLSGTLILVRVAHVPAFETRSVYVNPYDRKNLNRAFPGSPDGTQTERIAWALSTELIANADFVIDLHSGDGAEWLTPFVGVYGGPKASNYPQALAVAKAFRFPNLVRYQMHTQEQIDRGRSLNRQAVAAGKPTILVEIGENGERYPAAVAAMVDGLYGALVVLYMIPAPAAVYEESPRLFDGTTSVPVQHSGLWHPKAAQGRAILKGEFLGSVRGYDGTLLETVYAPVAGYAIYGLAGPPIRAGESVMSIALPTDSLEPTQTPQASDSGNDRNR